MGVKGVPQYPPLPHVCLPSITVLHIHFYAGREEINVSVQRLLACFLFENLRHVDLIFPLSAYMATFARSGLRLPASSLRLRAVVAPRSDVRLLLGLFPDLVSLDVRGSDKALLKLYHSSVPWKGRQRLMPHLANLTMEAPLRGDPPEQWTPFHAFLDDREHLNAPRLISLRLQRHGERVWGSVQPSSLDTYHSLKAKVDGLYWLPAATNA
jgi:hypothetical protein